MKRKQWSQRLRHVVLMCAAAFGLTAFGDEVSVSKPVVTYGADYTRATVTAAVEGTTSGDVTYELTVTKGTTTQTYKGTVSGGTVTFADVAVPREAADIYADITYTVTPKAGTVALTAAATTEAPTTKSEWAFSSRVNGDAVAYVGGSWPAGAPTVAENKLSVTDATFTAGKKSADDIVVITMEGVIFGDINDAEIADAQAGIRIGESGNFEVLSKEEWIDTEIPANGEEPYDVVLTINYATKKYSVKIGTGTFANISLAGSETGVKTIEFNGSGSLASLAGEAYDGNMVVDDDGKKYATVAAAIAALKAGTATAPLALLHDGTAPAGWTIDDENGVLTQVGIVVEEEETAAAEETKIVAVPYSTETLTAATLINMSNRTEVDETLVLKVYDKMAKDYNSWTYENGAWVANNVAKAGAGSEELKTSKSAAEVQLEPGDGVWVTYNPQAPLILNGTYATAGSVKKNLEAGYNLIAPPPTGAATYSVRSITSATAGDKVVIPAGTGKPPRSLTRKDGNWGYWGVQNGQPVWVEVSEKADVTVPAGTGFWYISTSNGEVTL